MLKRMKSSQARAAIVLLAGMWTCCLQTARADVFADAKYIWDFDHDLNGDGVLQADEVRELRSFGATNAAYAGSVKASKICGNDLQPNGPTFVTTDVWHPGRGLHYTGTTLHFTVDNRETTTSAGAIQTNCCPVGFQFNNTALTGSVTVLMRCRMDSFNSWDAKHDHAWVVNNGEYWGVAAGSNFGFVPVGEKTGPGVKGNPSVYFGRSELAAGGIVLDTNIWYDVGIALKDTGDGGAEALFVVHDQGRSWAYSAEPGSVKGRVPWNFAVARNSYKPGSGCFTNEVHHATAIKIGAENPGERKTNSGANKGFAGDLQRVAMWHRALTEKELKEAIAGPNQVFRIGVEDGKAGEFGDRAQLADVPYSVSLPERDFHLMPSSVDAAHPTLSISFTPYGDNHKNGQLLRVKGVTGGSGVTWLRPTVNGTALPSRDVERTGEAVWYVKASLLKKGANELVFTRLASSTATSLAFDVIEMTGSWFLGLDNWGNGEFSNENGVQLPNTAYASYCDWGNIQRGLPTSWRTLSLRFFVPAYQAQNYDFVFRGRTSGVGGNNLDRYVFDGYCEKEGYIPYSIYLNGANIYTNKGVRSTSYAVSIPAGTLSNGWNTIQLHNDVTYYNFTTNGETKGASCWILLDYHALEIQPRPNGTILILR